MRTRYHAVRLRRVAGSGRGGHFTTIAGQSAMMERGSFYDSGLTAVAPGADSGPKQDRGSDQAGGPGELLRSTKRPLKQPIRRAPHEGRQGPSSCSTPEAHSAAGLLRVGAGS